MITTPYLFFTGKGGVGKTTIACATAIQLADEGKRVLLVCTDPASNLAEVLETEVGEHINPVKGINNLFALNIDPEVAAEDYRMRVTGPLKDSLSETEIAKIREQLSGACTTEISAFDEFSRFISGEYSGEPYDVIVFDTAPTGHTLRLLELPAAWSSFTEENPEGASCLGPSSALKSSRQRYQTVVERLKDAFQTTFNIVARPEQSSLKEASRTSDELRELGMENQELYLNGVFTAMDRNDTFALKMEALAHEQLKNLPVNLQVLPKHSYPLLPYNILGPDRLRSMFRPELQSGYAVKDLQPSGDVNLKDLNMLVEALTANQQAGLIMTMGKGGVGKTLTATAIALLLAEKGMQVHLTTTDPAAHIRDFISQLPEIPANLTVDRINPKEETQRYIDKIVQQKGKNLDEEGIKLLLEDLKSPCTEEVAVFHAFSKAISESRRKFVVMDTAPTGHTLLLLDTAGSYHRDIMRNMSNTHGKIRTPYMTLQDSSKAKILLVSLPETTPMQEAAALQEDLKRAGIKPYAWIVNQSLSMVNGLTDPLLKSRADAEKEIIEQIKEHLSEKTFGIPYLPVKNLLPELLNSLQHTAASK